MNEIFVQYISVTNCIKFYKLYLKFPYELHSLFLNNFKEKVYILMKIVHRYQIAEFYFMKNNYF